MADPIIQKFENSNKPQMRIQLQKSLKHHKTYSIYLFRFTIKMIDFSYFLKIINKKQSKKSNKILKNI